MCGAPECKGVVFGAEHELRAHAAREHGDAMSRAERRQARTIPITLQARVILRVLLSNVSRRHVAR